jgi:hypothetical protein
MIPELEQMLTELRKERANEPLNATVMRVFECQNSMTHAAAKIGMKRITHHDLRHLFATICIESGVDIPTVSRWLGAQGRRRVVHENVRTSASGSQLRTGPTRQLRHRGLSFRHASPPTVGAVLTVRTSNFPRRHHFSLQTGQIVMSERRLI